MPDLVGCGCLRESNGRGSPMVRLVCAPNFPSIAEYRPESINPYIPSPFGAMPSTERRDRLFEAFDEIVQGFEDHGLPGRQWRRMSEGLAAA